MAKRITRADGSLFTVENMHTQRSPDAFGDKISASKKIVCDNVERRTKHRRKRRLFLLYVTKWRTDVSPTSVVSGKAYNTRLSVALNGGMRNGRKKLFSLAPELETFCTLDHRDFFTARRAAAYYSIFMRNLLRNCLEKASPHVPHQQRQRENCAEKRSIARVLVTSLAT